MPCFFRFNSSKGYDLPQVNSQQNGKRDRPIERIKSFQPPQNAISTLEQPQSSTSRDDHNRHNLTTIMVNGMKSEPDVATPKSPEDDKPPMPPLAVSPQISAKTKYPGKKSAASTKKPAPMPSRGNELKVPETTGTSLNVDERKVNYVTESEKNTVETKSETSGGRDIRTNDQEAMRKTPESTLSQSVTSEIPMNGDRSSSSTYTETPSVGRKHSIKSNDGMKPKARKRSGVDGGKLELKDVQIETYPKDKKTLDTLKDAVMANDFLKNIMDAERLDLIVNCMMPGSSKAATFIITEGDIGFYLYISDEGSYEVLRDGKWVSSFGPGVVFGELAILYKAKRLASIRATSDVQYWMLDRQVFQKIMIETGRKEQDDNMRFLSSVSIFRDISKPILYKISDLLRREFYKTGSYIIKQGERGDKFYIIRGGTVTVKKKDNEGRSVTVGVLKRGDYFGEKALLTEERRLASIIANDPGTECLALDKASFLSFIGPVESLKQSSQATEAIIPPTTVVKSEFSHVALDELELVGTLGVGGFGRVELVQYRNRETFALKYLKKIDMVQQQQQEHVYNEKNIMAQCNCEFIIKLYATFKDNKYLYFLMEPCLGGDLWGLLQKHRRFDEKISRFFTACVVAAFEYLHTRNIVYRDLKPENLMLDAKGYVKLIDFGFAKIIGHAQKTWTFAGTPEYVAPEIILNKGHDRAVDYWALGIFIHELLVGKPPFRGKGHLKTYTLILRGIESVDMPSRIPKKAQDLIKRLCRQIPAARLGYQKQGIADIKTHTWFNKFEWDKLKNKTMVAPLIQPVRSLTDLSNFDECPSDRDEPQDETSGWDRDF
ncbi:cGMP-dependent protein kinase 1 isoform X2 [Phlebotomus papatasi]|uniref:cGMP-dependent protein kinase 1 isoform X2 n=1 Tax=Phlebotomus papatasi TaxID=29031 RepID=UPI002483C638|nr:cGMP-dependent protein kinase 1 isoform X2 [Phlebotomus papatasi]XP_055709758.1 cGMP-dependent protein kinase 1 isoform X2 [Phlebotomus papatasi]